MSNGSKRNDLHLAALYASTEVMDMLAAAKIPGINTADLDKDGHSPNQCFLKCRSASCAIKRKGLAIERRSWARLMASVRGQAENSLDFDEGYEDAVVVVEEIVDEDRGSFFGREESLASDSEEEYVDAEDGSDRY